MYMVNFMGKNSKEYDRKEYNRQYYLNNREKYLQRGKTEEALEKMRKRSQLKSLSLREENLKLNQQFIKDNGLVEHPDFPGYYGTKNGKVFSNTGAYGKIREIKPFIVKKNNGYYLLSCGKDEIGRKIQIYHHQFIAQIFLLNPNNYTEINHIDEDKSNNSVENLEWCDRQHNVSYSLSKTFIIKNLKTGEKVLIKNLSEWCRKNNIDYCSAINMANGKGRNKTLKNKTYVVECEFK
jgi:hypothetical protein